jgi:hypothetical protein
VRAEDAAEGVGFVDDHQRQVPQERAPALMARQDALVEHVGVGEHEVGVAPHHGPLLRRCVAVVGGGADAGEREGADRAELIVGERLGGGQVQRGAVALAEQGLEHGELVAEALAAGGPRGDHHVGAGARQGDRLGLVAPQLLDPSCPQSAEQDVGEVVGQLDPACPPGRQSLDMDELTPVIGVAG